MFLRAPATGHLQALAGSVSSVWGNPLSRSVGGGAAAAEGGGLAGAFLRSRGACIFLTYTGAPLRFIFPITAFLVTATLCFPAIIVAIADADIFADTPAFSVLITSAVQIVCRPSVITAPHQ